MTKFSKHLRRLREADGLNQAQLAKKVGCKWGSIISEWETGKTVPSGERRAALFKMYPELEAFLEPSKQLISLVVEDGHRMIAEATDAGSFEHFVRSKDDSEMVAAVREYEAHIATAHECERRGAELEGRAREERGLALEARERAGTAMAKVQSLVDAALGGPREPVKPTNGVDRPKYEEGDDSWHVPIT